MAKQVDMFPWLTDRGKASMIGGVVNEKKLTPVVQQLAAAPQRKTAAQIAAENAAAVLAAEAAKTQRLNTLYSQASGKITSAYSPYTDQFFTDIQNQYATPYIAELNKQKELADKDMLFTLARQGLMDSSASGNLKDRIASIYKEESDRIQGDAKKFADTERGSITEQQSLSSRLVDNAKNDESMLLSLINSPISVTAPQTPKKEVTLGDVFTAKMATRNPNLPQAVGGFGMSSAQSAATSGASYATPASPTFRSPVRGQGKSFYAR
jgi:hypothetical protein